MERTGHVPLSKSVCLSVKHTLENTVPGTAEEAEKTLQQTFRYFFFFFFNMPAPSLSAELAGYGG